MRKPILAVLFASVLLLAFVPLMQNRPGQPVSCHGANSFLIPRTSMPVLVKPARAVAPKRFPPRRHGQ